MTYAHARSCAVAYVIKGRGVANHTFCSVRSVLKKKSDSMKPVKAAMSKIMEITLLFIFCSTIFNLPDVSTARAQLLPQRECEKITNVTFLTFLPCLKEFGDSASTFEQLDSCDFLTRAAVELAAERVNRNWNVSGNSQRFLNLTPLHGVSDSVGTRDLPAVSNQHAAKSIE